MNPVLLTRELSGSITWQKVHPVLLTREVSESITWQKVNPVLLTHEVWFGRKVHLVLLTHEVWLDRKVHLVLLTHEVSGSLADNVVEMHYVVEMHFVLTVVVWGPLCVWCQGASTVTNTLLNSSLAWVSHLVFDRVARQCKFYVRRVATLWRCQRALNQ